MKRLLLLAAFLFGLTLSAALTAAILTEQKARTAVEVVRCR